MEQFDRSRGVVVDDAIVPVQCPTVEPLHTLAPDYDIREYETAGIIRMVVRGFFDPPTLHRHFADNRVVVERWRAKRRPIRVLIDAIDLMPHTPEGQAIVQAATASIYRDGDKVAVLVSSNLVKMQMRRALKQGDTLDFFISERVAMLWLHPARAL